MAGEASAAPPMMSSASAPESPETQPAGAKPAIAPVPGGANGATDFIETPIGEDALQATPSAAPVSRFRPFGFLNGAGHSSTLLGTMWGFRPLIAQYGMTFNLQKTSEVLGNVSGGTHRGFDYEGLTVATFQLDRQRAFGWYGGQFNVSGLQIHGRNLSADNLQTLQTASGIEADRATRLWELWYQQKFLDDKLDIKIGQQSLDQEFMGDQNAGYFVNTMFGWPMLPSADLPGGGAAYPLSALGVRLRAHLSDSFTLLAGAFSGSPVENASGDPQKRNRFGTDFPLNRGLFAITELQWTYPGQGAVVRPDQPDPMPRTYKIGIWYDNRSFADLRYDNAGLSLADPTSTGVAARHRGDYAIYVAADQMVWRSSDDPDRNINVFVRPMLSPLQGRNLISFSMVAGAAMHEPIFGRDDDTFGIGMGFARLSSSATGLDRDTASFNPGSFTPLRHHETSCRLFERRGAVEPEGRATRMVAVRALA